MLKPLAALCLLGAPAWATGLDITVSGEANGTIVIDLFEDLAPKHAEQIAALARAGAYDGVVFHRVIDGFVAQTGDVQYGRMGDGLDMRRAGSGKSDRPDLPAEISGRSFTRGMVGMARGADDMDSANSQFFIMLDDNTGLDGGYSVVGQVVSGMDVVDAIKRGAPRSGAVIGRPDVMDRVVVTD